METLSIPTDTLCKLRRIEYGALGIDQGLCGVAELPTPAVRIDALYGLYDYLAVLTNAYSAAIDAAETSGKEAKTAPAVGVQ